MKGTIVLQMKGSYKACYLDLFNNYNLNINQFSSKKFAGNLQVNTL